MYPSILYEKVRIKIDPNNREEILHMPYPEIMIHGMRAELAQLGFEETKTPEEVKSAVENTTGQ
jgi:hypothetical protein